jgi:hypothetical protein
MDMDWLEDAIQQVRDVSAPGFSNKLDAVPYYRHKYGDKVGKKGWKQHLIQDLLGIRDVRPDIDKEYYQKQYKNLSKRFDSGAKGGEKPRLDKPELKTAHEYQDLARHLGLIKAPPNGYHVHFKGGVLFSKCEPVEFDVDVVGELADELAAHPDRLLDIVMRIYLEEEDEEEASASACELDSSEENVMLVTANDEEPEPRKRKKHKYAKPFMKR